MASRSPPPQQITCCHCAQDVLCQRTHEGESINMASSTTRRASRAAATTDSTDDPISTKILIIGSGFSGLGMAAQLRRRGYSDFLILEKASSVGGTWRDNTYPGCACDVPSLMYSYSFESRGSWSKVWSSQPEIERYLQDVADKRGVTQKIHFGQKLVSGYWSESESRWHLRTESGREYIAQFVVSGVGALHIPPNFPNSGLRTLKAKRFTPHSGIIRWIWRQACRRDRHWCQRYPVCAVRAEGGHVPQGLPANPPCLGPTPPQEFHRSAGPADSSEQTPDCTSYRQVVGVLGCGEPSLRPQRSLQPYAANRTGRSVEH